MRNASPTLQTLAQVIGRSCHSSRGPILKPWTVDSWVLVLALFIIVVLPDEYERPFVVKGAF